MGNPKTWQDIEIKLKKIRTCYFPNWIHIIRFAFEYRYLIVVITFPVNILELRILFDYCNVDETAKYKLELNSTTKLIATMKIKLKFGMQAIHLDDLATYSRKLKAKSSEHKMSFTIVMGIA